MEVRQHATPEQIARLSDSPTVIGEIERRRRRHVAHRRARCRRSAQRHAAATRCRRTRTGRSDRARRRLRRGVRPGRRTTPQLVGRGGVMRFGHEPTASGRPRSRLPTRRPRDRHRCRNRPRSRDGRTGAASSRRPAANRVVSTKLRHPHGPWRWTIRSLTFVRKELAEILRQPRLLVLLVVGPFVLLLLFGTGYSQNTIRLHTLFVGEQGSIYEETLNTSSDQLNEFVENEGFVSDKDAALALARRRRRRSGGRVPRRSARRR